MEYLKNGGFKIKNFSKYNYLYFPLCNHYGMKSSITPNFNGDAKTDQFHFALAPASNVDLLNGNNCRNVWFVVDGQPWNIVGNSILQKNTPDDETLECGFLYQKVTRSNSKFEVNVTSFVPEKVDLNVELHKVSFTNKTKASLKVGAFVSIPIYGRSADNIRDHRHVTALLNRVKVSEDVITNKPTLSFDERGHNPNNTSYSVCVSQFGGKKPIEFYPTVDEFMGEGGTLEHPCAVYTNISSKYAIGDVIGGYEALGGFKFSDVDVRENETVEIVYAVSITEKEEEIDRVTKLCNVNSFNEKFEETLSFWQNLLSSLEFKYGKRGQDHWMKWVALQPILRRIYGCSFLPHHDYGKGGKGWRDLWQDCLALIKMDPSNVRSMLINNFAGTRIDGSNATIIGDKLGEFKADRNNIVRMWMDHGAWPFVTTKLYIDNTDDYKILFEEQPYFKDNHISFSQDIDSLYNTDQGCWQLDKNQSIYRGTLLEHILVENLAAYFNVGKHNNCKLMSADWNDGLDMAEENGESVAFTALYALNLFDISQTLLYLKTKGIDRILVYKELGILIDSKYDSSVVNEKRSILANFFDNVKHCISGEKIEIDIEILAAKLVTMYDEIKVHINAKEWLETDKIGYYNGYYDNDAKQLENAKLRQMILTGQVFTIMSGIAPKERVEKIAISADELLYSEKVGGYRLNTDFNEVKHNMGRLFGFAYGHKENGAVFSHMAIMYANALYRRNFASFGYKVINTIFSQVNDFDLSKTLPGIPEYFDYYGRGMYPYLTGSASWLILTMVEEVFGVKPSNGELCLTPRLMLDDFDLNNEASIKTIINHKKVEIIYQNPNAKSYGSYVLKSITFNGKIVSSIKLLDLREENKIVVVLDE